MLWSSKLEPVAHAAFRGARDGLQARGVERDALGRADLLELRLNLRDREALEVELQAARQHGDRQLLRIGRREQELDVRRRLFERFQQRVERMVREHVHLVDEVHLEAAARRRVLNVVEQLARVVDLGARGGVDLDEIDEPSRIDGRARRADAAGLRNDARLAVQRFREQARDGGLADAARAREQIRVMQPVVRERIGERLHDVRLPDELLEPPRPPFARQNRVTHAFLCFHEIGGPRQPDPGTQPGCYRCSLPGLTGFTAGCRGGTDADHRYFTSLGSSGAIRRAAV